MPWPASEIGAHQSTIVNTVKSGAPGLVGQKRVWHAGLDVSLQHFVAGPGVPARQASSSYGRHAVLKTLDEHAWSTQQARKVLEYPHVAGAAQVTALPSYQPHVLIPMEASPVRSNSASFSTAAVTGRIWLVVPECSAPVGFDAVDRPVYDAVWRMLAFMTGLDGRDIARANKDVRERISVDVVERLQQRLLYSAC